MAERSCVQVGRQPPGGGERALDARQQVGDHLVVDRELPVGEQLGQQARDQVVVGQADADRRRGIEQVPAARERAAGALAALRTEVGAALGL